MAVSLNHTIVWCRNRRVSADWLTDMLALPPARDLFRFRVVDVAGGLSLDFADADEPIAPQHYAFLVDDATFDHVMARLADRGQTYWADPARAEPGQINRRDGGRGVYFEDPDGHFLETLTVPYGGSKGAAA